MESSEDDALTVGSVAELLGVSVRTLHHWESIGLVAPSGRTWSGYRLYSPEDVARLHRALVYRETGMPLAKIREVLDDPGTDPVAHLLAQRELLDERIAHLHRMVRAVDTMLDEHRRGRMMTLRERAEAFGTQWTQYEAEAQERWGDTDDWRISRRRTEVQSEEERAEDSRRMREAELALASAMDEGVVPGSERANGLAEDHRAALTWFDVTHSKHVLLARMYVSDPRFIAHFDEVRPGLASWLKDVIEANARANGVDPDRATWR